MRIYPRPPLGLGPCLLLWLAGGLLSSSRAVCFLPNGTENSRLQPCNPSSVISQCCGSADFCTDNGLCLHAGGNNGYSEQGCTDKDWSSPCHRHCSLANPVPDGYNYMTLCSPYAGVNNFYCCGTDTKCCSNDANLIKTIEIWRSLSRPGGGPPVGTATGAPTNSGGSGPVSSTSDGTSSTSASTSTSTGTGPPTGTSGTGSSPSQTGQSQEQNSGGGGAGAIDKNLAIGAGVGVPLGAALIVALAFLGWQVRKQNSLRMNHKGPAGHTGQPGGHGHAGASSLYPSSGMSGVSGVSMSTGNPPMVGGTPPAAHGYYNQSYGSSMGVAPLSTNTPGHHSPHQQLPPHELHSAEIRELSGQHQYATEMVAPAKDPWY